MLVVPMFCSGIVVAMLLLKSSLFAVVFVMGITGFLSGPLDIALFTLRQRRTHRDWTGRAFAVSMAFNYIGTPIGSALAGFMAARSIEFAIALGAFTCLISGVLALIMIPQEFNSNAS